MAAYYNEFDPFAAAWLRELIKDGLIADGVVDERSITEVEPNDIKEFTQCHFFAGIGGWSLAARLAGWSDDRPMWTGSPPCQPFSVAGNKKGKDDLRHLWPVFFNLIRECKPSVVFGEQVASAIRHEWFDDLRADMEKENYATAMVVLPACSVNAPHKRDRLFYAARCLANPDAHGWNESLQSIQGESSERSGCDSINDRSRSVGNANNTGLQMHGQFGELHIRESNGSNQTGQRSDSGLCDVSLAKSNSSNRRSEQEPRQPTGSEWRQPDGDSSINDSSLGNAEHNGSHGATLGSSNAEASNNGSQGQDVSIESQGAGRSYFARDLCDWKNSAYVYCRDDKIRPVPTEPALFPLADGLPNRVGILRGAGNAIVPQVAAEVIKAYMQY